eukprot:GGOE01001908.1.p1 GENE.GGOE01001908.1~~GGOE01001908.1.p1  ORF type:complete len:449 (-),score=139.85 GGOE01001908.1:131-1477(-)
MTGSLIATSASVDDGAAQPGSRFFSQSDYVLTVGEGDFAFSVQLARIVGGANLLATTICSQVQTFQLYPQALAHAMQLDLCGAIVSYNVDATARKVDWDLQFDKVVFNFPESILGPQDVEGSIPDNQFLLAAFFYESARMLMPNGQIYVSIKKGYPFDEWNLKEQAERCPYIQLVEVVELPHAEYPVYQPLVTDLNESFPLADCELYVFQLLPEYNALAQNNNLRSEPHHPPTCHLFSRNGYQPLRQTPVRPPLLPALAPPGTEAIKAFLFSHNHDQQGIMYYLGLKAGNFNTWVNPVQAGLVTVRASSVKKGSAMGSEVADHTFSNQVFYTDSLPGSHIVIDFSPCAISPTCYTMAHRAGVAEFFARSWLFQGSVDGVAWQTLRRHVDDQNLHSQAFVASWAVDAKGEFFQQFRVLLDNWGNSRKTNALVLSCFEVYGRLREEGAAA